MRNGKGIYLVFVSQNNLIYYKVGNVFMAVPNIVSEYSYFVFDIKDNKYVLDPDKAKGFVDGLLVTNDKTTLIFKNLITSRSIVYYDDKGMLHHNHQICIVSDVNSEQFVKILQYDRRILNTTWLEYLHSIVPCKLVESLKIL